MISRQSSGKCFAAGATASKNSSQHPPDPAAISGRDAETRSSAEMALQPTRSSWKSTSAAAHGKKKPLCRYHRHHVRSSRPPFHFRRLRKRANPRIHTRWEACARMGHTRQWSRPVSFAPRDHYRQRQHPLCGRSGKRRVQRFDLSGKFLGEWPLGRTYAVQVNRGVVWAAMQPIDMPAPRRLNRETLPAHRQSSRIRRVERPALHHRCEE